MNFKKKKICKLSGLYWREGWIGPDEQTMGRAGCGPEYNAITRSQ